MNGYLVIVEKEIHSIIELRGFYDQIPDDNSRVLRSIHIKKDIQASVNRVISAHLTQQYVFPANESILPNAIIAIAAGEDISNCSQLKNIVCSISNDIQSNPKKAWPPNPQGFINSEDACHRSFIDWIINWIINPNSCMDDDGVVKLLRSKSTKVKETCQNIEVLVSNAQSRLSQALLSLNMCFKTG